MKGDAYEGLLERNAQDVKGGAGQYFTPRPLINAIVDCIQPKPGEIIADPACGTGGFLLAAHGYVADPKHYKLDKDQKKHLRYDALRGIELVDGVSRLCAMNLFLHGVGPDDDRRKPPIRTDDSLRNEPPEMVDVVLTNPPFGKKSSITVVNDEGETDKESVTYKRPDFWTTTSNKQLNFVQHVKSLLKIHGRAAVVLPDNVLFEGGAGEKIRRKLLQECEVHTILRLPTGIFYPRVGLTRPSCLARFGSRTLNAHSARKLKIPNDYEQLLARVKELQAEGRLPTTPTREQRISWAYGQTKLENVKVTRDDAVRAVDAKPEFTR